MTTISFLQKSPCADPFLMENDHLKVYLTNFGASIFVVQAKHPNGDLADLTLTCSTLEEFTKNRAYFGATVGRTANRIKNGTFTLNEKNYHLPLNDGNNSSHGGNLGFSRRLWQTTLTEDSIQFSLHRPNGEEGYPRNLDATVTYRFDDDGKIEITHRHIRSGHSAEFHQSHIPVYRWSWQQDLLLIYPKSPFDVKFLNWYYRQILL